MKKFLKILKTIFNFTWLTVLTQVGGIIYLLYQPFSFFIKKKYDGWKSRGRRILSFVALYLFCSLLIVPLIAKRFGRVPLPFFASKEIPVKAGNIILPLGNRHYVRPQLKAVFFDAAQKINQKYPNTQLLYLDANFPFWNGFPLLPHLSHDDGEKLDIAFLFKNKKTQKIHNNVLSFLGYGFVEPPRKGESNTPATCAKKGKWQYNFLYNITSQHNHEYYEFDSAANQYLMRQFINHPKIGKILIEPHLKSRLGLSGEGKVRAAGCHAVRHDDHIHVQL